MIFAARWFLPLLLLVALNACETGAAPQDDATGQDANLLQEITGCLPDCSDRECGLDPVCGLPCGSCQDGSSCTADGYCTCCEPDCSDRECGPDPVMGVSCGVCPGGERCYEGVCVEEIAIGSEVEWVSLAGGVFLMGSEEPRGYRERPVHQVGVSAFDMTRSEVTVAQYRACRLAEDGCRTDPDTGDNGLGIMCNWGLEGTDDHPVNCVDWQQAVEFCAWVGGRLPTESEWEYAARSEGRDQAYPWGDEYATCSLATMDADDSGFDVNVGGIYETGSGCGTLGTASACARPFGNSAQGLCDLAGNVGEWVEDDGHSTYGVTEYSEEVGHPDDGSAWLDSPRGRWRIIRGGNFHAAAFNLRAAYRSHGSPSNRYAHTGFRCVRDVAVD